MNILIVGGGSVGQVLALHLADAGATVSFLVKQRHAEQARSGFSLYRLRRWRPAHLRRLVPNEVVTDQDDLENRVWDLVWLCVSSEALRNGSLRALSRQTQGGTIISLGQDIRDHSVLTEYWSEDQIVQLAPSLLAYPMQIEGSVPPATAYWTPPGSSTTISGQDRRARDVRTMLKLGGLRAKVVKSSGVGEMKAALAMPYIAALEIEDWSLRRLRANISPAVAAAREAAGIVAAAHGLKPPNRITTSAWNGRLALRLFPLLAPFDLQRYIKTHFTKVNGQTRLMLDDWIAEGQSRGLPTGRLEYLQDRLINKPIAA